MYVLNIHSTTSIQLVFLRAFTHFFGCSCVGCVKPTKWFMTDVHKQSLFSIYQWSIVTTPTHAIFFILFGLLWLDNIVFAAIRLDIPLHKIDFNAHCFTLSVFGFMFSEIFSKKFNCQTFNSCRGSLGVINHIFPQSRK